MKALGAYSVTYGKRAAAFLAILAMLAQAALVALTIPVVFAASSSSANAQQPGYQSLVICTGTGLKRITIDAQGNRVAEEEEETPLQDCPACAMVGHAVLAPVYGDEVPFSHNETAEFVAPASQQSIHGLAYLCAKGRGPPLQL